MIPTYAYMVISRILAQLIVLAVIFPSHGTLGKGYIILLGAAFIYTNYLLGSGKINSISKSRTLIGVETALVLVLYWLIPIQYHMVFFAVQLVTVCILFRNSWERNLYAVGLVSISIGLSLSYEWVYYGFSVRTDRLALEILPYLFFYFAGNAIRKQEMQREELQELNLKLAEYSQRVKELAVTEERNRLAREIHDTVAHRATGLIMQLQAAKSLAQKKPEDIEPVLDNCLQVSRSMLDEMRKSVRALAPIESENLISESGLRRLIDDFSKQTGVAITLQTFGKKVDLQHDQQVAVYRAIQEALTNAKLHGNAEKVDIIMKYLPDALEVNVTDYGKGCTEFKEGFGLSGMRSRMEALGGELSINFNKGGCQLVLLIPYRFHAQKGGATASDSSVKV